MTERHLFVRILLILTMTSSWHDVTQSLSYSWQWCHSYMTSSCDHSNATQWRFPVFSSAHCLASYTCYILRDGKSCIISCHLSYHLIFYSYNFPRIYSFTVFHSALTHFSFISRFLHSPPPLFWPFLLFLFLIHFLFFTFFLFTCCFSFCFLLPRYTFCSLFIH